MTDDHRWQTIGTPLYEVGSLCIGVVGMCAVWSCGVPLRRRMAPVCIWSNKPIQILTCASEMLACPRRQRSEHPRCPTCPGSRRHGELDRSLFLELHDFSSRATLTKYVVASTYVLAPEHGKSRHSARNVVVVRRLMAGGAVKAVSLPSPPPVHIVLASMEMGLPD
ncbi:hypothetical protein F4802DRAFT_356793 [Xylaria palmicola]|nr:hypothetical protein F4802DRAFT_356793 [Xylaria palmicola]